MPELATGDGVDTSESFACVTRSPRSEGTGALDSAVADLRLTATRSGSTASARISAVASARARHDSAVTTRSPGPCGLDVRSSTSQPPDRFLADLGECSQVGGGLSARTREQSIDFLPYQRTVRAPLWSDPLESDSGPRFPTRVRSLGTVRRRLLRRRARSEDASDQPASDRPWQGCSPRGHRSDNWKSRGGGP